MGREHIRGLQVRSIRVDGKKESSMVKRCLPMQTGKVKEVFGKMGKGRGG